MKKLGWVGGALLAVVAMGCGDDEIVGGNAAAGGAGGDPSVGGGSAGGGGAGGEAADCEGTQSDDPQFAQALELMRNMMLANGVPGGAIAVVQDGELVNMGVVGSKRKGVCDPVTPDTLFMLPYSSINLTTIAALDAVDEGKLSLTAPVADVVPLVVEHGAEYVGDLTLHHLLTSTGMYTSDSDAQPQEGVCMGLEEYYANPVNAMIEAPPGSMGEWDDRSNIELASWMLETVDGEPFPDVIRKRVLEPLGMGGTFDIAEAQAGDYALGYQNSGAEGAIFDCPNHHASYGYWGSIQDAVKLAEYMTSGTAAPLGQASYDALLTEQGVSFFSCEYAAYTGPSWRDPPIEERLTMRGGGVSGGFNNVMYFFPDRGLALVVMYNLDNFSAGNVGLGMAEIYGVDRLIQQWVTEEYDQDPESLATLAGTYVDEIGVNGSGPRTVVVTVEGDVISAELSSAEEEPQPIALENVYCADNFSTSAGPPVRFWRDEAGESIAIQVYGHAGPPFFRVTK